MSRPRPSARLAAAGLAALGLAMGAAGAAGARDGEGGPVVVELFTSQGCAVCRPADALALELARRPGIVLLTLPVTYWDYLGWRDTLAQRAFNERQRAYAASRGERQILTPQAVVNGGASAIGSDRKAVERLLREAGSVPALPVSVSESAERLIVDLGASADSSARAEVLLVSVARSRTVVVEGGESPGRVVYADVVRGIQRIGSWSGRQIRIELPHAAIKARDADSYVVLVQAMHGGRPGRIYGAAKGPGL